MPHQLDEPRRAWVNTHRELVEQTAARLAKRYTGLISEAELLALGHEGLVSAARHYRQDSDVPFARFARYRIQGAMIDGVRAESTVRRTQVALERAASRLLSGPRDPFRVLEHGE